MTNPFGPSRLPAGNYRFGFIPGAGIAMCCMTCDKAHENSSIATLPPFGLINDARDAGGYMETHEALYHPELKAKREIIYVVWSVHHHGYYRHGGRGYSIDVEAAQRFTIDDALPLLTSRAFTASPLSAYALVAAPENWPTADEATNAPDCSCGHSILWHRNEFRPAPVGCEADECMCERTPQQILAEIAAGQGRNHAAPAFINYGMIRQQVPSRRAWRADGDQLHQRLETDRGIVLGACGHWWQAATVEPSEPMQVLERAGTCPWDGRPATVIVGSWEEVWPEPSALDTIDPSGNLPDDLPMPDAPAGSATERFVQELEAPAAGGRPEDEVPKPIMDAFQAQAAATAGGRMPADPFADDPDLTAPAPAPMGLGPSIPITDPRPTRVRWWPQTQERPLAVVRPAGIDAGAPVPVCTEDDCGHLVSRHQNVGCLDCPCAKPYDSFADNALADKGNEG